MYRELILKTTINLYAHYGIRGVSMGQVAGALRISKKTLYAEFGSKEQLLCDCMDYEEKRVSKILANTESGNKNPVETIVMITSNLFQYKLYFCPAYHKDILRFKKAVAKLDTTYQKIANKYYQYLEKGKQDGYFLPDNEYSTIASILVELLKQSEDNKHILLFTFLRGLCTDKGVHAIDEVTPESLRNKIYNYN
ncbi:TetR/AcrR family transcriptional regulator [Bacteroides sp. 519]|uniref:TetR/AcrR family transcriptional regulator n=1 Tax=Bacteroides sp. 519 TaxID=2302937 RepID=UPI0013D72D85|nr:TetR/AcrR family transcriptional regulator [Bacteroides sp. 519]